MKQIDLFNAPSHEGNQKSGAPITYLSKSNLELQSHFLQHLHTLLRSQPLQAHTIWVVVPNNFCALSLKEAYTRDYASIHGLAFLTFVDFAKSCVSIYKAGAEKFFLDPTQELLLFREMVLEQKFFSAFFKQRPSNAKHLGFFQEVLSAFHQLLDEGIRTWPARGQQQEDLLECYQAYLDQLLSKYHQQHSLIFEASYKSQKTLPEDYKNLSQLLVYGFSRFTASQDRLIKNMSQHFPTHIWWNQQSLVASSLGHMESLQNLQNLLPKQAMGRTSSGKTPSASQLRQAQDTIRQNESSPHLEKTQALEQARLCAYPDVETELQESLAQARCFLSEHPRGKVGMLYRDAQRYAPLLEKKCQEMDLPYFSPSDQSLESSVGGRALQACLDYLNSKRHIDDVYRLLCVFPFQLESSDPPVSTWIHCLRESRHLWAHQMFSSRLELYFAKNALKEWNTTFIQKKLTQFFSDLERVYQTDASWADFYESLLELFEKHAAARNDLRLCLDSLAALKSRKQGALSLDWFNRYHLSVGLLNSAAYREHSFGHAQIVLLPLSAAAGIVFDQVFLLGVNDQYFPAVPPADPVLWDHQKMLLNQAHGSKLVSRQLLGQLEQLEFSLALGQSVAPVRISYAAQVDGEAQGPSIWLNSDKMECFSDGSQEGLPKKLAMQPANTQLQFQKLLRHFPQLAKTTFESLPNAKQIDRWAENHYQSPEWTAFDGALAHKKDAIQKLLPQSWSPTALESLATCPYRYFLRYILKLPQIQAPDGDIKLSGLDKGRLVHEILFQFYRKQKETKQLPLSMQNFQRYLNAIEQEAREVFAKRHMELPIYSERLWLLQQQEILQDLKSLFLFDFFSSDEKQPIAFELRFGGHRYDSLEDSEYSQDASVQLSWEDQSIDIHGKIDRVDASPDGKGLKLIDYKTGKLSSAAQSRLSGGKQLQLPLYLLAAEKLFPKSDLSQSLGLLLSFHGHSSHQQSHTPGSFVAKNKSSIFELLGGLRDLAGEAQLIPIPGKSGENCSFCDYQEICQKAVLQKFLRKKDQDASKDWLELEELHP